MLRSAARHTLHVVNRAPEDPSRIPIALRRLDQWVVWRAEDTKRGVTKVPYRARQPTRRASTRARGQWSDAATAIEAVRFHADLTGIGFVLTPDDPYVGIDLDDVIDPASGTVAPLAARAIRRLDTYTEASPSGTGVHLILEGSLEGLRGRKHGRVEVYEEGRYLTFTGAVLGGHDHIEARQAELEAFHAFAFPRRRSPKAASGGQTGDLPEGFEDADALSDYELLDRIFASQHGAQIEALYEGETEGYPSHSEADLALASHLAWWTGYDRERADRLFRGSELYRPKWDERRYGDGRTYGEGTLDVAFAGEPS